MSVHDLSQRVVIIGGGFSGLGVALELLKQGMKDFVLLEKSSQLGGTWRENTYPGCACDVPSILYSYSFHQGSWSRVFAEQPEIQAYLLEVAARHDVMPHVRLGTEVARSTWDEAARRWRIQTNRGELLAQFVVHAPGPLHAPRTPDLPGLSRFRGVRFHSAEWRHDHDLRGKRVAVLGTGSSAIQFVPEIQPRVERLHVFQRTPGWVLPKPDRALSARTKWAMAEVPGLRRAVRGTLYGLSELVQIAQRHPPVMAWVQERALRHLERQVKDTALRAALTPSYTLGCKRILLSNTYYPALQAANTSLVPHAVTAITEDGVIGADGVERPVDTLIFGTGFRATDAPAFGTVFGRGGQSLEDAWGGSPEAYLGTTCHGFPNAFFMLGPNLGNGHGSAFVIIEAQARYIAGALRSGATTLEVRRAAQREWNDQVQAGLTTTVFNAGGCKSWYLDQNGRNSAIYPWTTIDLRRRLRRFASAPFDVGRPKDGRPPAIDLAGAVVAISGGARGIGLATARRFADAGAVVCLGDLDLEEARLAAATLGPRASAHRLDVTRRASWEAFVAEIARRWGPIDVLVNNAGVMPTGRFLDEPDEVARAAMAVNLHGLALGMKVVVPRMIDGGRGHVVNVASLAGKLEVPFMATYVATKHAAVGLTGAVRQEIAGSGVTLSTVMPGAIKTQLSGGIPLGGLSARDPDEVARAIVRSCRTREADIVVPRSFTGVVPLVALVPRRLRDWIFARLQPDRLLAPEVRSARVDYEGAIAKAVSA